MYITYFEPELLALQEEIINPAHTPLQLLLNKQAGQDLYVILAEVATYCGIILDGMYTNADMLKLCDVLTRKLYEKRTSIVLLH